MDGPVKKRRYDIWRRNDRQWRPLTYWHRDDDDNDFVPPPSKQKQKKTSKKVSIVHYWSLLSLSHSYMHINDTEKNSSYIQEGRTKRRIYIRPCWRIWTMMVVVVLLLLYIARTKTPPTNPRGLSLFFFCYIILSLWVVSYCNDLPLARISSSLWAIFFPTHLFESIVTS